MAVFERLVRVIASFALAVTFVAGGFFACIAPPVTHVLSNAFAKDDLSPFDRTQLVKVAEATRDFSFGEHSELALYQAIYGIDVEFKDKVAAQGGRVDDSFPKIEYVTDVDDVEQYRAAFAAASELYCYSADTVSHLDDCNAIARVAYPTLAVFALVGLAGAVLVGLLGRRRRLGGVLLAAGAVVIVAFIGLGVWAGIDFSGFFAAFHSLLFSQGNWTFPYDSLLICALPTEFWMGMGVIWLAMSVIISILSIIVGLRLRKHG